MALIGHSKGVYENSLRVFIATPTYSGKTDARFTHSLLNTIPLLKKEGVGYEFFTLSHHCHVDDARNEIVTKFMDSNCDELIFIDADVSWKPESLVSLIKHDRNVVAGVYPKRSLNDTEFPVLVESGVELWSDECGLVEVLGAPTGFMKIKRHVIEQLIKKNSKKTYYSKSAKKGDTPHTIIFKRTYENGQRFSGDYSFCRSWKALGGKIYVDPKMNLSHTGEVEFLGTLENFWKEKYGVYKQENDIRFKNAIDSLRRGECLDRNIDDLVHGWGNNPFSASHELLSACFWLSKESKGYAVEAGSGLTTLIMALANPHLKIHCLEHDILWASKLKYVMQIYNIENIEIHLNDLIEYESGKWYDISDLPDTQFSIALCDGPPRKISDRSLFFTELNNRTRDSIILIDDVENVISPIIEWSKFNGRDVEVLGSGNKKFAISKPSNKGSN